MPQGASDHDAFGGSEQDPTRAGHPSQAEGEDPDNPPTGVDPALPGHPSQAEGEDDERAGDSAGGS